MRQVCKLAGPLLGLLLAACQSAAPAHKPAAAKEDVNALSQGTGVEALTDPCALRLQEIQDAMLIYYTVNRTLPPNLAVLHARSQENRPLDVTCPVSHQPYIYTGVSLTGGNPDARILIVYDAAPVHNGRRWAIVTAPSNPGQTLTMWVAPLDDKTFKYLKSVTDEHAASALHPPAQ